jgi:antirestriction protein ArdC
MNVFDDVTSRVLAALEKGVVPWVKPWAAGTDGPTNVVSRKPYRGCNVLLLSLSGYTTRWWLTFTQARALGGLEGRREPARTG